MGLVLRLISWYITASDCFLGTQHRIIRNDQPRTQESACGTSTSGVVRHIVISILAAHASETVVKVRQPEPGSNRRALRIDNS